MSQLVLSLSLFTIGVSFGMIIDALCKKYSSNNEEKSFGFDLRKEEKTFGFDLRKDEK